MQTFRLSLLLWLLVGLAGCELFEKKDKKEAITICGNSGEAFSEDGLKACKPRDTLLKNGVFVKYVIGRGKFSLRIGRADKLIELDGKGYRFDCSMPRSVVPVYQWSSDKIIALKYGCGGNYCSYNTYLILDSEHCVERMNVIGFDSKHNLITYIVERDSIVIENVSSGRRISYSIPDRLQCTVPMDCVESVKFTGKGLVYTFDLLNNGTNKKVLRRFRIPDRLF